MDTGTSLLAASVLRVHEAVSVNLFGRAFLISRDSLKNSTLRELRLPARDLAALTPEEAESALIGLDTGWEYLDDELSAGEAR